MYQPEHLNTELNIESKLLQTWNFVKCSKSMKYIHLIDPCRTIEYHPDATWYSVSKEKEVRLQEL